MDNIRDSLSQYLWRLALILGGVSTIILLWRGNNGATPAFPEPVLEANMFDTQLLSTPILRSTSASVGLLPTITPTPLPPTLTPTPVPVLYIIEQDDVAVAIADKYGVNVDLLLEVNGISDPTTLQIGQQLHIPVTVTPAPPATPTPEATSTPTPEPVYHTVESGDMLSAIAIQYDTSVEAIVLANELANSHDLQIGQELLIPPETMRFDTPTTLYEIQQGDTLLDLAGRYGSTLDDIMSANSELEPTSLQIGQKIIIPQTQSTISLPAHPTQPKVTFPADTPPDLATLEQLIIAATNAQRQAQGLQPYATDAQLTTAARAHAQDMVIRGYFSHISPEGYGLRDRLREHGLSLDWVGENILRSIRPAHETPQYAINWFMADRPHRLNLLHNEYNKIGVGVAQEESGWYTIVQVFAKR
jgi:uncharacterized protein YkwD